MTNAHQAQTSRQRRAIARAGLCVVGVIGLLLPGLVADAGDTTATSSLYIPTPTPSPSARAAAQRAIEATGGARPVEEEKPRESGNPQHPVTGYKIFEQSTRTELKTPSGNKLILGDFGPDGTNRYRIDVPLENLTPTPTATAVPLMSDEPPKPEATPPFVFPATPTAAVTATATPSPTPTPTSTPTPTATPTPTPTSAPNRSSASLPYYDDSDYFILKANRLYNRRKYMEAGEYVDELLRRRPDSTRGWVMKGSLMWVQGHKDLAKKAWEQALALEPESVEVQRLLERVK